MDQAVIDLMAAGLPPAPALPVSGYGQDVSCTDGLARTDALVSGNRLLGEACYRRLTTPRGRLLDDPNYGMSLPDLLNDDLSTDEIARIQQDVDAELRKDERVLSTAIQQSFLGGILTLVIIVTGADGPFQLVIAASSVSVDLLRVGP